MRNLNKYLIRNLRYTASWEDAQHSFQCGKFFSTLDAKSGYWTISLNKRSHLLTAFNTPFRKYCLVCLPFGLSVSSEIICEHVDRGLSGIPGTFPCVDDAKVQRSTEKRHDIHLLETIQKAQKKWGLKINPDMCNIKKTKIEYLGCIVTPDGVRSCPKKVKAISNLEPPKDQQELQSFLGSINFLSTFIPNLAQKTYLMRGLLKKDVQFVWTCDMQMKFSSIKDAVVHAVQLHHYDPNGPAIIEHQGKALLQDLVAVLLQDGKPVRFLSKSLITAEVNYSNIERELFAVLVKSFIHTYLIVMSPFKPTTIPWKFHSRNPSV